MERFFDREAYAFDDDDDDEDTNDAEEDELSVSIIYRAIILIHFCISTFRRR